MSLLTAWANFYVIVGSSAGALTGLTFVAITLVAARRQEDATWGVGTFTTPTVVHFGTVLFVSAHLSAPWPSLAQTAVVLGLCGVGGVVYGAIVVRRMRRRGIYQPVGEDWLWYAVVPLAAYVAVVVMAVLLPLAPVPGLFGIAAVTVALLFVAIRNAWDIVTYIAIQPSNRPNVPHGDPE